MITLQPLVSLGLTVRNGGYIFQTMLDSILSQGFQNFELIVLDNASTDQTEAIGRSYASKDSRIRYYRHTEAQQELSNRNRILKLATGAYFKFITFEEAVVPHFLEHYVELMNHSRGAFLENCFSGVYGRRCSNLQIDQSPRFPPLEEAPETPLLSVDDFMWQQDPQEWLSEKLSKSDE